MGIFRYVNLTNQLISENSLTLDHNKPQQNVHNGYFPVMYWPLRYDMDLI